MEKEILSLLSVIAKYETTTESLYAQLDFYYVEQEKLRSTTTALLKENKTLADNVEILLQLQTKRTEDVHTNRETDIINNLKMQLSLMSKEKDSAIELWQTSLRTIDQLEDNLKVYQTCAHDYTPKETMKQAKQQYEDQIRKLEKRLETYKEEAIQYRSKEPFLVDFIKHESATFNKSFNEECKHLQDKIVALSVDKKELKKTLISKSKIIQKLQIEDVQSKTKVNEALQLIEIAFLEKDAALQRELECKVQIENLSKLLTAVNEETPDKIKNEIQSVKTVYSSKLQNANDQIHRLNENIHLKSVELDKLRTEHESLCKEFDKITKGNPEESQITKLLMLEKNLESTFQQLLLSEKKSFQLAAERDNAKVDLEQIRENYKNDIRARDAEQQVMKQKIEISQRNLDKVNAINRNNKRELDTVKTQMENIKCLYNNDIRKKVEKLQRKLYLTFQQLELQVGLNNKWREEMKIVIEKFQNQFARLKCDKKELQNRINELDKENLSCRKSLKDICSAVCVENK